VDDLDGHTLTHTAEETGILGFERADKPTPEILVKSAARENHANLVTLTDIPQVGHIDLTHIVLIYTRLTYDFNTFDRHVVQYPTKPFEVQIFHS
tara:strand:- start:86 stop:370 length:285 start_codon:yes stop_codon:yes gene_type:complete